MGIIPFRKGGVSCLVCVCWWPEEAEEGTCWFSLLSDTENYGNYNFMIYFGLVQKLSTKKG